MSRTPKPKPLGEMLREAGLINDHQIEIALSDQAASGLRLGEILILRGWIKRETLNYFLTHAAKLRSSHVVLEGGIPLEPYVIGEQIVYRIVRSLPSLPTRPCEILPEDNDVNPSYIHSLPIE